MSSNPLYTTRLSPFTVDLVPTDRRASYFIQDPGEENKTKRKH